MARIFDSIVDTIGHTPLVRAPRCSAGLGADVAFKLESFNPMASVKDRTFGIGRGLVVSAILLSGSPGLTTKGSGLM